MGSMRMPRPTHSGVVAYLALLVALSGTAVAANGSPFLLGRKNHETSPATITSASGPAVRFNTAPGTPPFTVNRPVKVARLNADLLDGKSARAFLPRGGKAVNADLLDGLDSGEFQRNLQVNLVTAVVHEYYGAVDCPTGWVATGGGFANEVVPSGQVVRIDRNSPRTSLFGEPIGWSVWAQTNEFENVQRTIYAVCVK
jgi:hypothetical protein